MKPVRIRRFVSPIAMVIGLAATECNSSDSAPLTSGSAAVGSTSSASSSAVASASATSGVGGATAASTTSTTNSSSSNTSSGSGGASAVQKIVGVYYPNWTPAPPRIRDLPAAYNLVYLFAATPVGGAPGTTGAVAWTIPGDGNGAATNFNADIAEARTKQGRKIILTVGGAGNGMSFPNHEKSMTFVASVEALHTELGGFDGLDWDTFEGNQLPDTTEMIWISLALKAQYPGFLITTPPAPWDSVDQTFCSDMVNAGALDYAAPQYYDGPNLATQSYIVGSIDVWSSLIGADKVVVGFGVANLPNYMTIDEAIATWKQVAANHPTLRGAFDWDTTNDQNNNWSFANQLAPLINP